MVNKKFTKILSALLLLLMTIFVIAACTPIKMNAAYNRYIFNGTTGKFETQSGRLEFYADGTFKEFYYHEGDEELSILGTYVYETETGTVYGKFGEFEVNALKSDIRRFLSANGVSSSRINELLNGLGVDPVYTVYKGYIFKYADITGARTGDIFTDLSAHDGEYEMKTTSLTTPQYYKFTGGEMYSGKRFEGGIVYEENVGKYFVENDFITIEPKDGIVKQQKYLFAEIKLPIFTPGNEDETLEAIKAGNLFGNADVDGLSAEEAAAAIESLSGKKIRVLVTDFYTTQTL